MQLSYDATQSPTDRFTFYLVPNLTPLFNGEAISYSASLERSDLDPQQQARMMDAWLAHRALMLLNTHEIGKWCRDPSRSHRVLINTSEVYSGLERRIRLRFISGSDATLFKLTFG